MPLDAQFAGGDSEAKSPVAVAVRYDRLRPRKLLATGSKYLDLAAVLEVTNGKKIKRPDMI